MATDLPLPLLLLILMAAAAAAASDALFNASVSTIYATISRSPPFPAFLKEVVEAITEKERWDAKEQVRVLEVDHESARIGRTQRYEFHVKVGMKTVLLLGFSDEVLSWRKMGSGEKVGPDLTTGNGAVDKRPAVGAFELEGPLYLQIVDGDDELSILLPATNVTHKGIRRVLVGDGITISVQGSQVVSLVHPQGIALSANGTSITRTADRNQFLPIASPFCAPLLSVRVVGSASITAYRPRNREAHIETLFQTPGTIELLPDKCLNNVKSKPFQLASFGSLSSRLAVSEELLGDVLGYEVFRNSSTRVLKAKIVSSALVKFRMELERRDESVRMKGGEWKSKPDLKQYSFEVVARVEEGARVLKPVVIRRPKRGFVVADSTDWRNLMANVSFTQFPSAVVPPEALTLDVKW